MTALARMRYAIVGRWTKLRLQICRPLKSWWTTTWRLVTPYPPLWDRTYRPATPLLSNPTISAPMNGMRLLTQVTFSFPAQTLLL